MPGNTPRLLLVTPSVFNPYSGGGITLTNLFRGWPAERIATIHTDFVTPDESVCRHFYRIGEGDIEWEWPQNLLAHGDHHGSGADVSPQTDSRRWPGSRRVAESVALAAWKVSGSVGLRRLGISPRLRDWVRDYRPDVIYSLLGDLPYIRLVSALHTQFRTPVVVHMMDDWPSVIYRNRLLSPHLRRRVRKELRRLIDQSAKCLGICGEMCEAFEERYGQPFTPFHNALDVSEWLPDVRQQWQAGQPFTMAYSGAIVAGAQLESLSDVCDAALRLRASGLDIEMRIYSPSYYADRYRAILHRPPAVQLCEAPEQHNVAKLFAQADLLILPVNFDRKSVRYIRYSMPTKVPAYMISGSPVLVYGPDSVASVQYARDEGWGYVVAQRGVHRVEEAVRRLVGDEALRRNLGQRARQLALQNHDAATVRPAFWEVLREAANYRN